MRITDLPGIRIYGLPQASTKRCGKPGKAGFGAGPSLTVAAVHGGPGGKGSLSGMARRLAEEAERKSAGSAQGARITVIEPLQSATSVAGSIEELHEQLARASRSIREADEQCARVGRTEEEISGRPARAQRERRGSGTEENSPAAGAVRRAEAAAGAVLLGHSWGAMLSILYAARYPDHVEGLILVGCPPLTDEHVAAIHERRRRALGAADRPGYDRLTAADNPTGADLQRLRELTERSDGFDALPPQGEADPGIYAAVWPEAARMRLQGEFRAALGALRCPVTVIHGLSDPHPVEGVTGPLEAAGIRARVYPLDRCGHSPFRERQAADLFYSIVIEHVIAAGQIERRQNNH